MKRNLKGSNAMRTPSQIHTTGESNILQKYNKNQKEGYKTKQYILDSIMFQIEYSTGLKLHQLKEKYSEDNLFKLGLFHVTTTKKALCMALKIPVEAGCRYKRNFEKEGSLVQSIDEVICPYTKHLAHELSTNPNEFERLLKSNTNQLNLFD
jgi:hypothetical protein